MQSYEDEQTDDHRMSDYGPQHSTPIKTRPHQLVSSYGSPTSVHQMAQKSVPRQPSNKPSTQQLFSEGKHREYLQGSEDNASSSESSPMPAHQLMHQSAFYKTPDGLDGGYECYRSHSVPSAYGLTKSKHPGGADKENASNQEQFSQSGDGRAASNLSSVLSDAIGWSPGSAVLLEQDIINKQRHEIQILMEELGTRDQELNDLVSSHQKQVHAWEVEREKFVSLHLRLRSYEEELMKNDQQLKDTLKEMSLISEQREADAMEFKRTQDEMEKLAERINENSHYIKEMEFQNKSLKTTLKEVMAERSQLVKKEQELTRHLDDKDQVLSEKKLEMNQMKDHIKYLENRCEELEEKSVDVSTELGTWKRKFNQSKEEMEKLLVLVNEKEENNQKMTLQLQESLQQATALQKALFTSCEREKCKEEVMYSLRKQHKRTMQELQNMRELYDRQNRDLSLYHLSVKENNEKELGKKELEINKKEEKDGAKDAKQSKRDKNMSSHKDRISSSTQRSEDSITFLIKGQNKPDSDLREVNKEGMCPTPEYMCSTRTTRCHNVGTTTSNTTQLSEDTDSSGSSSRLSTGLGLSRTSTWGCSSAQTSSKLLGSRSCSDPRPICCHRMITRSRTTSPILTRCPLVLKHVLKKSRPRRRSKSRTEMKRRKAEESSSIASHLLSPLDYDDGLSPADSDGMCRELKRDLANICKEHLNYSSPSNMLKTAKALRSSLRQLPVDITELQRNGFLQKQKVEKRISFSADDDDNTKREKSNETSSMENYQKGCQISPSAIKNECSHNSPSQHLKKKYRRNSCKISPRSGCCKWQMPEKKHCKSFCTWEPCATCKSCSPGHQEKQPCKVAPETSKTPCKSTPEVEKPPPKDCKPAMKEAMPPIKRKPEGNHCTQNFLDPPIKPQCKGGNDSNPPEVKKGKDFHPPDVNKGKEQPPVSTKISQPSMSLLKPFHPSFHSLRRSIIELIYPPTIDEATGTEQEPSDQGKNDLNGNDNEHETSHTEDTKPLKYFDQNLSPSSDKNSQTGHNSTFLVSPFSKELVSMSHHHVTSKEQEIGFTSSKSLSNNPSMNFSSTVDLIKRQTSEECNKIPPCKLPQHTSEHFAIESRKKVRDSNTSPFIMVSPSVNFKLGENIKSLHMRGTSPILKETILPQEVHSKKVSTRTSAIMTQTEQESLKKSATTTEEEPKLLSPKDGNEATASNVMTRSVSYNLPSTTSKVLNDSKNEVVSGTVTLRASIDFTEPMQHAILNPVSNKTTQIEPPENNKPTRSGISDFPKRISPLMWDKEEDFSSQKNVPRSNFKSPRNLHSDLSTYLNEDTGPTKHYHWSTSCISECPKTEQFSKKSSCFNEDGSCRHFFDDFYKSCQTESPNKPQRRAKSKASSPNQGLVCLNLDSPVTMQSSKACPRLDGPTLELSPVTVMDCPVVKEKPKCRTSTPVSLYPPKKGKKMKITVEYSDEEEEKECSSESLSPESSSSTEENSRSRACSRCSKKKSKHCRCQCSHGSQSNQRRFESLNHHGIYGKKVLPMSEPSITADRYMRTISKTSPLRNNPFVSHSFLHKSFIKTNNGQPKSLFSGQEEKDFITNFRYKGSRVDPFFHQQVYKGKSFIDQLPSDVGVYLHQKQLYCNNNGSQANLDSGDQEQIVDELDVVMDVIRSPEHVNANQVGAYEDYLKDIIDQRADRENLNRCSPDITETVGDCKVKSSVVTTGQVFRPFTTREPSLYKQLAQIHFSETSRQYEQAFHHRRAAEEKLLVDHNDYVEKSLDSGHHSLSEGVQDGVAFESNNWNTNNCNNNNASQLPLSRQTGSGVHVTARHSEYTAAIHPDSGLTVSAVCHGHHNRRFAHPDPVVRRLDFDDTSLLESDVGSPLRLCEKSPSDGHLISENIVPSLSYDLQPLVFLERGCTTAEDSITFSLQHEDGGINSSVIQANNPPSLADYFQDISSLMQASDDTTATSHQQNMEQHDLTSDSLTQPDFIHRNVDSTSGLEYDHCKLVMTESSTVDQPDGSIIEALIRAPIHKVVEFIKPRLSHDVVCCLFPDWLSEEMVDLPENLFDERLPVCDMWEVSRPQASPSTKLHKLLLQSQEMIHLLENSSAVPDSLRLKVSMFPVASDQ